MIPDYQSLMRPVLTHAAKGGDNDSVKSVSYENPDRATAERHVAALLARLQRV